MTNDAYSTAGRDILGADARLLELPEKAGAYYYKATPVRIAGKPVIHWKVGLFTATGGLNRRHGDFNNDYDRLAASTLDSRFERTLCLPPLQTAVASPDPAGNIAGMHHCRGFSAGTLIIAAGTTDDSCLFYDNSGTITAITGAGTAGRPGSAFTCASVIPSNGSSLVLLGRAGAAPITISDTAGTIAATGHANLNPTWGVVPTPFGYNLYYAAGAIQTQSETGAISAAPVDTGTDMRNGGYVLGVVKRGGGPARMYMWEPNATNTSGGLLYGSEVTGQVVSVNLEGYDKQPMNFEPYLAQITWAAILDDGILASDGNNLVWNNGHYIVPIGEFNDRSTGGTNWVRGAAIIGRDCYIRGQTRISGLSSTVEFWDYLDLDKLRVHQLSATQGVTFGTAGSILPGGSLPWSLVPAGVSVIYSYANTGWVTMPYLPVGVNAFSRNRVDEGPTGNFTTYAASGSATWPKLTLPGLEGMGKVVRAIHYLNNPNYAGGAETQGTTVWEELQSGISRTFDALDNVPAQSQYLSDNAAIFDVFEPKVTITQISGAGGTANKTSYTSNALPVIFEGWAAYDRDFIARLGQPPERLELAGR